MIQRCLPGLVCLVLFAGASPAQERDKSPDQQVKDLLAKYQALPAKDQTGPEGTGIIKQLKAVPGTLSRPSLEAIARLEAAHNLRQIALSLHQYGDKDAKPPAVDPKLGADWTAWLAAGPAQEDLVGWARETAEDFLRAVLGGRGETAKRLLTAEARPSFHPTVDLPPPPNEKVKYKLGDSGVQVVPNTTPVAIAEVFRDFAVETSRLAPGQDEVVFRGVLKGERQGKFTLRVLKEKEGGKWRVWFFDAVIVETPAK